MHPLKLRIPPLQLHLKSKNQSLQLFQKSSKSTVHWNLFICQIWMPWWTSTSSLVWIKSMKKFHNLRDKFHHRSKSKRDTILQLWRLFTTSYLLKFSLKASQSPMKSNSKLIPTPQRLQSMLCIRNILLNLLRTIKLNHLQIKIPRRLRLMKKPLQNPVTQK